jgi:hypothetical protein
VRARRACEFNTLPAIPRSSVCDDLAVPARAAAWPSPPPNAAARLVGAPSGAGGLRPAPEADVDALAPMLVGTGHLLFAGRQNAPPKPEAVREVVAAAIAGVV